MNQPELITTIDLPSGVSASTNAGRVTVKGPKGEVTRHLFHPRINASVIAEAVELKAVNVTRREKKMIYTFTSHIKNMVDGVTEGHNYQLKVCSGHFPMTVAIKGDTFEVKNFLGEAVPRTLKLDTKTTVKIDGVVITVDSVDLEAAGQMAARIEQLCKRAGFDRRIFQDGIYITHKCGKAV
jgi:large subunit ribosomal protein L6